MLLNAKGDYETAIDFNEKALELFPSSDIVKDNLATSYYQSEYDYLDEVKKLCKDLITREVGFPEPYYTYALLMEERGKLKASRKYLKMALQKEIFYLSDIREEDLLSKLDDLEAQILEKQQEEVNMENVPDSASELDIEVETDTNTHLD
jgi:tetratricopeptide (TPR) repeat protein